MGDDLGTWTRPQAEAIRDVLAEQGLSARLRSEDGRVRVTVPRGEATRAHRVLAGRMRRVTEAGRRPDPDPDDGAADGPPLVLERFRRWGGGIAVLVAVMFVALETPGPFALPAAVLTLLAIGAFRWWRSHDDGARYGPDA